MPKIGLVKARGILDSRGKMFFQKQIKAYKNKADNCRITDYWPYFLLLAKLIRSIQ